MMIAPLLILGLNMVVQYHADIGIVLHVLKLVQPAVLDTDTLDFNWSHPISHFFVSLFYYLTVLVTLLMYTVEIKINKYVMTCKHCTDDS